MNTKIRYVVFFVSLVSLIVSVEVFGYLLLNLSLSEMATVFLSFLANHFIEANLLLALLLVYIVLKIDKADFKKSVSEKMGVNYDEGRSLLGAFFSFLRHPRYDVGFLNKPVTSKLWDVSRLVGIAVFLSFIIGLVITFVLKYVGYDYGSNSNDVMIRENILLVVISVVIMAPLIEEVVFRSFLRYRPFRLSLFIGFVYITFLFQFVEIGGQWEFLSFYSVVLLVFFGLGLVFKFLYNGSSLKILYHRYFFVLFYGVALVFGFAHIFNYSNWMSMWFLAPLLVLPQIVGGFMLGYVRMLYGLKWAVFFHLFFNGFLIFTSIVSYYFFHLFDDLSALGSDDFLLFVVCMVLFGLLCVFLFIGSVFSLVEFLVNRFNVRHPKNTGKNAAFFLYHH